MNTGFYLFVAALVVLLLLNFLRIFVAERKPSRGLGLDASIVMSVIVSLAVLGSALYIILSAGYDASAQKWAFGAVGTIIGYWLPKRR